MSHCLQRNLWSEFLEDYARDCAFRIRPKNIALKLGRHNETAAAENSADRSIGGCLKTDAETGTETGVENGDGPRRV